MRWGSWVVMVMTVLCVAAVSSGAAGVKAGTAGGPPVDFHGVALPEEFETEWPFDNGLPASILPKELAGTELVPDSVRQMTTYRGTRVVLAKYGDTVVTVWKAPVERDRPHITWRNVEKGDLGVVKAASVMDQIMRNVVGGGHFYGEDQVTGSGEDPDGLLWFTTAGKNFLYFANEQQTPIEQRHAFWFRSGVWLFGVDAPEEEDCRACSRALVAHLEAR